MKWLSKYDLYPGKINRDIAVFALLGLLSLVFLFAFVDLRPKVDQNFFFSSSDPQFKNEKRISKLFVRKDTQLIIIAYGDIRSRNYLDKVSRLSDLLSHIHGVTGVKSLTRGPAGLSDALNSPLWKSLLIGADHSSSHLIVLIEESEAKEVVDTVQKVVSRFADQDFRLRLSGVPYAVRLIQENLLRDIRVFSLIAFLFFSAS